MTTITNPDKTPVAGDVFTFCTKEKIETWHVVRNHTPSGIVDRVVCKACKSEHKYKSKIAAAAALSSRKLVKKAGGTLLSNTKPKVKSPEEVWFAAIKKWGEKPVESFDSARHLAVGEVFSHPSFGKGVVQARRENKIDVVFTNGLQKTLISK